MGQAPLGLAERDFCLEELRAGRVEARVGRHATIGEVRGAREFGIRQVVGRLSPVDGEFEIDLVELRDHLALANRVAGLNLKANDLPGYLKRKVHRSSRFNAACNGARLTYDAIERTGHFDRDWSLHVRCRPCIDFCLQGVRRGLRQHIGQERRNKRDGNGRHGRYRNNKNDPLQTSCLSIRVH